MKRSPGNRTLAFVALAVGLTISACSSETNGTAGGGSERVTYQDKNSIPQDPAEQVYEQVCMACHATGVGPVITGRDLPPEAVKLFVRNGSRAMPAFTEAMIDDETLDRVAQLVAASEGPTAPAAQ